VCVCQSGQSVSHYKFVLLERPDPFSLCKGWSRDMGYWLLVNTGVDIYIVPVACIRVCIYGFKTEYFGDCSFSSYLVVNYTRSSPSIVQYWAKVSPISSKRVSSIKNSIPSVCVCVRVRAHVVCV